MKTLFSSLFISSLFSVQAFAVTLVCVGPGGNGPLGGTQGKNPYWMIVRTENDSLTVVGSIVDNKSLKLSRVKSRPIRDLYQLSRADLNVSLVFPKAAFIAQDEKSVKGVQVQTFWKYPDDGENLKLSLDCIARDPRSVNFSSF